MSRSDSKVKDLIASMKRVDFTNEHGERFEMYSNGMTVLMAGDEVRDMVDRSVDGVIELFNPQFNIWSPSELYLLGKAISELGEHHMTIGDMESVGLLPKS